MTRGCHRLLLFVQQAPPSVSELGEALSRALVLGKLALPEPEHVLNGWRKAVYFCALRCPRRVGWQYEGGGEGKGSVWSWGRQQWRFDDDDGQAGSRCDGSNKVPTTQFSLFLIQFFGFMLRSIYSGLQAQGQPATAENHNSGPSEVMTAFISRGRLKWEQSHCNIMQKL